MQLQGEFTIPADRDAVWNYISDPTKVIQCVPGIQSFTVGENKRISASVKVSIGFIRGTFQATNKVVKEDVATHTATMELNGSGAGSGFSAVVNIGVTGSGSSSDVTWDADVNISGPLGSLAKPLIQGNIKKIVEQLFDCVKSKLSQT